MGGGINSTPSHIFMRCALHREKLTIYIKQHIRFYRRTLQNEIRILSLKTSTKRDIFSRLKNIFTQGKWTKFCKCQHLRNHNNRNFWYIGSFNILHIGQTWKLKAKCSQNKTRCVKWTAKCVRKNHKKTSAVWDVQTARNYFILSPQKQNRSDISTKRKEAGLPYKLWRTYGPGREQELKKYVRWVAYNREWNGSSGLCAWLLSDDGRWWAVSSPRKRVWNGGRRSLFKCVPAQQVTTKHAIHRQRVLEIIKASSDQAVVIRQKDSWTGRRHCRSAYVCFSFKLLASFYHTF